jgi:hypothetical protein
MVLSSSADLLAAVSRRIKVGEGNNSKAFIFLEVAYPVNVGTSQDSDYHGHI